MKIYKFASFLGDKENEFFGLRPEGSVSLKDSPNALIENDLSTLDQVAEKLKNLTRPPQPRAIITFNEEDYVICWCGKIPPLHVIPLSPAERNNFLKLLTVKICS